MATKIRAELSKNNEYWIEKHRYYELKHFCLQYPIWKRMYYSLDGFRNSYNLDIVITKTNDISDPVYKCVEKKMFYLDRIKMIENVAFLTDISLAKYLIKGVTENMSYDILKVKYNIPCCKDTYYKLYRRFFWLLSKERA